MVLINFSNIEELIFENSDLPHLLPPDYFSWYEQWRIGRQFPFLRSLGKEAILEFLNAIDSEHIRILEGYFQDKVVVEKLNYNIVRNVQIPLADLDKVCDKLCEIREHYYYSTWRDDNNLYLSFWR